MYTSHLQHRVHCLKLLAPLIHCLLAKLDEATLVSSQHAITTYEDMSRQHDRSTRSFQCHNSTRNIQRLNFRNNRILKKIRRKELLRQNQCFNHFTVSHLAVTPPENSWTTSPGSLTQDALAPQLDISHTQNVSQTYRNSKNLSLFKIS